MKASAMQRSVPGRRSEGEVLSLDAARIERALRARHRYRYVRPRLEATASGWKVFSRNCSRSVDPAGGEIAIAWLRRCAEGWSLYARDHAASRWVLRLGGEQLAVVLAVLCEDPNREFWP